MPLFQHTDTFAAPAADKTRVYIWLTRYGALYFAVLIVMLLGSINYKNNMGMLLTFLLAGIALISLFATHRSLSAIAPIRLTCSAPFAGDPMTVSFEAAASHVPVPAFTFTVGGATGAGFLGPDGRDTFHLSLPTERRGQVALDRVRVETVYPLGLFRSWRVFRFEGAKGVIYPAPITGPMPVTTEGVEGDAVHTAPRPGAEDFDGHRRYAPGDPPRHIDWRVYSRGQGLFTKTFAAPATGDIHLVWNHLPEGDPEYRLSIMCHAVLSAHRERWRFGMRLPWAFLPPDAGPRHVHACLTQLALMGGGAPQ